MFLEILGVVIVALLTTNRGDTTMVIIPIPDEIKHLKKQAIKSLVKHQVKRNKIMLPYEIEDDVIIFNKGKQTYSSQAAAIWNIWR